MCELLALSRSRPARLTFSLQTWVASVPLTDDDDWRPLAEGEGVAVRGGEVLSSRLPLVVQNDGRGNPGRTRWEPGAQRIESLPCRASKASTRQEISWLLPAGAASPVR